MKIRLKHLGFAGATTAYFCMLLVCTPVEASKPGGETDPTGEAAVETGRDKGGPEAQHEDILDRAFAPLDNAVSDINRDLNKKEDDAAPAPGK